MFWRLLWRLPKFILLRKKTKVFSVMWTVLTKHYNDWKTASMRTLESQLSLCYSGLHHKCSKLKIFKVRTAKFCWKIFFWILRRFRAKFFKKRPLHYWVVTIVFVWLYSFVVFSCYKSTKLKLLCLIEWLAFYCILLASKTMS